MDTPIQTGVKRFIQILHIAHQPSVYVLDTPAGVLVPSIPDIARDGPLLSMFTFLARSVTDSVVGEERIAHYLHAVLNSPGTPFHWRYWNNRRAEGIRYDAVEKVEHGLKDLRPKTRKPPNTYSEVYIEVRQVLSLMA
ncbi:hypothetical protein TIFTF001_036592 [Ficus carica]|uniref:Uncharacterized protein n=1 Tax=Ficus carica TaxID=3494 RepID=A0AA88E4M1_FICCA|nr:hypothetical protein TIFTF001_036592 [Ficus carica]